MVLMKMLLLLLLLLTIVDEMINSVKSVGSQIRAATLIVLSIIIGSTLVPFINSIIH